MEDFQKLFASFADLKVGVIGDVMLDTYMWGRVDRISPEAPVPVVVLNKKEYRIGGAGNVALNCRSLGAQVALLSVTGEDQQGMLLEKMLLETKIDSSWIVKSKSRMTSNKMRILSRNQQMIRIDEEHTADLDNAEEKALLEKIQNYISDSQPDLIIFEDYNKGVLTSNIIEQTIAYCKAAGVMTAVDPKRKNFFSYKEVDIFKPNLKEVQEGLNFKIDEVTLPHLQRMHNELHGLLKHNISLITLSDKGVFYQQEQQANLLPSHFRNISDVSGAGDTVIAVAAMTYAVSKNGPLMAAVANIAGGLVCEEVGTVAINKEKLLEECMLLLS